MPLRGEILKPTMDFPGNDYLLGNFLKFRNTPYMDRMTLGVDGNNTRWGPGHEIYDTYISQPERLEQNILYIKNQMEEFKTTEPFTTMDKVTTIWRKYREGIYRDNKDYSHDGRLRQIIRDAINVHNNRDDEKKMG